MNKIVVITGGTSGIGLSLKEMFEKAGDVVFTISTREMPDDRHYSASVSDEDKMSEIYTDIANKYGHIDIIVNNAGFGMSGITELVDSQKMKELFEVNYLGTLYCIRSALKYMRSGGKVVNISSAMALFPVPYRAIYASAKSAVHTLSLALRMELRPLGIDVVDIAPGDVKTNFTRNRIKEFRTDVRYGDRLEKATFKSDSREDKRMSTEYCAKKIFDIIGKKRTRPFYIIGTKYKFLYFLTRITPKSWLLYFTNKLYGGLDK